MAKLLHTPIPPPCPRPLRPFTVPQMHLDDEIVTAICKEYRCLNADVTVRYPHATVDELIDVIEGNRFVGAPFSPSYVPSGPVRISLWSFAPPPMCTIPCCVQGVHALPVRPKQNRRHLHPGAGPSGPSTCTIRGTIHDTTRDG